MTTDKRKKEPSEKNRSPQTPPVKAPARKPTEQGQHGASGSMSGGTYGDLDLAKPEGGGPPPKRDSER